MTTSLLSHHHGQIEAACIALLAETYADDPRSLASRWHDLEGELLEHLATEEATILPKFAGVNPEAAANIRDQHLRLLELINRVGLEAELHVLRAETMRTLVHALRAHAVYEGLTMYRWAESALEASQRESLAAQL